MTIDIKVEGLDKLEKALERFPKKIDKNLKQAGKDAAEEILDTQGLRRYPPATAANLPPAPYYQRGSGTIYASGKSSGTSENYGKKWNVEAQRYTTRISNSASYAPYLAGEQQARAMQRLGWRKIFDVAKEKMSRITRIFQKWIDYTIRELGL